MELIRKKFKVLSGNTGTYNLKILLTSKNNGFGYFDAVTGASVTGTTITHPSTFTVTGESKSRLEELRKYSLSGNFNKRYFTGNTITMNGYDVTRSRLGDVTGDTLVYYISGITYYEVRTSNTTGVTFSFQSQGYNSSNFINKPIIKDESIEEIITKPKVIENVFIDRQQVSVFENNYRLRNVRNITELQLYAGGNFFNIVNNT
ncbi:MAG: hypothetical protein ACOCVF_01380 [bacterium]